VNNKRRVFIKGTLAAGTVGVALGAGLLTPRSVLAAWPKSAFDAENVNGALEGIVGTTQHETSGDIKIKAPDIAENGAVVPITVSSSIEGITSMSILADQNARPLTSSYNLPAGTAAYVSTRVKMGKTANVIAVVKAGDKVYSAKKQVKVTIGGCGG
jgi:sulfur-oxidizing protein SoxY